MDRIKPDIIEFPLSDMFPSEISPTLREMLIRANESEKHSRESRHVILKPYHNPFSREEIHYRTV